MLGLTDESKIRFQPPDDQWHVALVLGKEEGVDVTTLQGQWLYNSFLIRPAPSEEQAPRGKPVTAVKWAMGILTVPTDTYPEVSGELEFAPGFTLTIKGRVLPASESSSAILVATGKGVTGPTKGSVSWITGAVIIDTDGQQSIYGSVLGVRGPDTNPDLNGGEPLNTVGTFRLSRQT